MNPCILSVTERDGVARQIELRGHAWLLGRGPGVDVQLDDGSVSRIHAELRRSPFGAWWIHDRGSTNGTHVNGSPIESMIIAPGDEIVIGAFALRLESNDLAEVPAWPARDAVRPEDRNERRRRLCELLVRKMGAVDALFVRVGPGGAVQLLAGHLGSGRAREPLSRSVLSELWDKRTLVVGSPTANGAHLAVFTPFSLRACPVLAQPLVETDTYVEALYVELASKQEVDRWRSIAPLVADAYRRAEVVERIRARLHDTDRVEDELETARVLQHHLIPRAPLFDGLEVITGYQPRLSLGGDYVDAIAGSDGSALLVIADVCGKGLQGALVGACLHTLLHTADERGETLQHTVGRMNDYLWRYLPDHSFVTLVAVFVDPRSGAIACVNAGHPPALLVRGDGRIRQLESGGNLPLGIGHTTFEVQTTKLEDDEVLVLYTDGFTELPGATDGMLGFDRFHEGVAEIVARGGALGALEAELLRVVEEHRRVATATDDMSFLLAQRRSTITPRKTHIPEADTGASVLRP